MNLVTYLRIYRIQIKNNWVRSAVYRINFLTSILTDFIWIGVEFVLFTVIYSNTPTLAGWTREQVFFFLGVFFASDALFTTFFQTNFWNFSDLVNKGELDILLTKPVHPLFLALSRWINITNILNLGLGLAITIRYAGPAHFSGGARWLLVPFWLLLGMTTQVLVRFTFSIWVFWTERSWALARLYYQFFQFATKPDTIYPRMIRYLILTALPFAFVSSIPCRALLHGLRPVEYAAVFGVLAGFFALNTMLWRMGLRRYQSASS